MAEAAPAPLRVAVGSKNPVKLAAVRQAFFRAFPDRQLVCVGHDVPSGVSDQPWGHAETEMGARQRALLALDAPAALAQRRAPVVDPPLALVLGAYERLHELFAPGARLVSLAPVPGFVRALERRAVVGADRLTLCRRRRRQRPLWCALDAEEGIARSRKHYGLGPAGACGPRLNVG